MTSRAEATLMEMDLTSNFLLSPIKDPVFSKSPIYLKTLSYCEDEAAEWQRQIKVTHHVTERRSRSLTRSFSDKFVDAPLGYRPLSLSSLSNLDRVKPIKPKLSHSVSENHIGKLASKVKKMKDSKKKENGRSSGGKENGVVIEDCKDSDLGVDRLPQQIVCPGTKLFEKHRKLSKQNTYVKEINRKNRPLPDPHENENVKTNRINLKESLNSFKKYRKIRNRPLPNPNEVNSEDEESVPFQKYKFVRSSRDGVEYCRVLDNTSPLPESLLEDDSEEEGEDDETENLYSEIDDYMFNRNELDASDEEEEIDSATYSNENSSKENSIDTKMNRTNTNLMKLKKVSRNMEVEAMIHSRHEMEGEDDCPYNEELESDHYATLTIDDEDDDEDTNNKENLNETELKFLKKKDGECFRDSLEDISKTKKREAQLTAEQLRTFVDNDGTIKKKYMVRQRQYNIYETLDEVKEAVEILEETRKETNEIEEKHEEGMTKERDDNKAREVTNHDNSVAEGHHSPYTSMITMIDTENTEKKTSISILKNSSPDEGREATDGKTAVGRRRELTSSRSIANLCDADDNDTSILMRGNTILIKVLDDTAASGPPQQEPSIGGFNDQKTSLRKCSSVSSINILLDDNEDDLILAGGANVGDVGERGGGGGGEGGGGDGCGSVDEGNLSSNDKDGVIHRRFPSMVTIAENLDAVAECNEITYYNEACFSIAIPTVAEVDDCDEQEEQQNPQISSIAAAGLSTCRVGNNDKAKDSSNVNSSSESIEIISSSNELVINGAAVEGSAQGRTRELDSKSLDSGNATDYVDDSENSFDADSLADDSELAERKNESLLQRDSELREARYPNGGDSSDEEQSMHNGNIYEAKDDSINPMCKSYHDSVVSDGLEIRLMAPIPEEDVIDLNLFDQASKLSNLEEETESEFKATYENIRVDSTVKIEATSSDSEDSKEFTSFKSMCDLQFRNSQTASSPISSSVSSSLRSIRRASLNEGKVQSSSLRCVNGTFSFKKFTEQQYQPQEAVNCSVTPLSPQPKRTPISSFADISRANSCLVMNPFFNNATAEETCYSQSSEESTVTENSTTTHDLLKDDSTSTSFMETCVSPSVPTSIPNDSLKSFYNSPFSVEYDDSDERDSRGASSGDDERNPELNAQSGSICVEDSDCSDQPTYQNVPDALESTQQPDVDSSTLRSAESTTSSARPLSSSSLSGSSSSLSSPRGSSSLSSSPRAGAPLLPPNCKPPDVPRAPASPTPSTCLNLDCRSVCDSDTNSVLSVTDSGICFIQIK